jgi:hypothetical protein
MPCAFSLSFQSILSSSTPDQVEDDTKDTVYQIAGIDHIVIPDTSGIAFKSSMRFRLTGRNDEMKNACLSVILPDQVEDDTKDMVYQTMGIAHIVIPNTSGIAFFIRIY